MWWCRGGCAQKRRVRRGDGARWGGQWRRRWRWWLRRWRPVAVAMVVAVAVAVAVVMTVAVAVEAAVAVAVAVVIPTPLRLQQPTVVLEGGWRGNACLVFKNTVWCLAPKGSSAFGIRVTGIRPSPQRRVKCQ